MIVPLLDFCGLAFETHPDVYEPSDDSELMVEAVRAHAAGSVLDLGTGTGVVGIAAAKKPGVRFVVCVDSNPVAIDLAKRNALRNGVASKMSVFAGDLFSVISETSAFDTIAFNPPYLPTSKEEKVAGELNKAFDGGEDGRKETDRFLAQFQHHLAPGGKAILLQSSLSGTEQTLTLLDSLGFEAAVFARRRFFFEEIAVIVASRRNPPANR